MLTPTRSGNRILHGALLGALISCQIASSDPLAPSAGAQKLLQFGDLPISFEPNRGQAAPDVRFVARGMEYSLSLLRTGARLDVSGRGQKSVKSLNLEFVNANTVLNTQGMDELRFKSHYFIGSDQDKWLKNLPNFARVRYSQVWNGVDVVFYGNENRLEYDLIVAPGANPKNVAVTFPGASLLLNKNGDLVVHSAQGDFVQNKPSVYQTIDNRRQQIAGRYAIAGRRVSFEIGKYDHSRELIIDPAIGYSLGRIGGFPPSMTGTGVGVDGSNNTIIGGVTPPVPVAQGLPVQPTGWIAKVDPVGNMLVKVSFAATDGPVSLNGLAADAAGNAYATGSVTNNAGSQGFPTTNGYQTTSRGGGDAYLIRFNLSGSSGVLSYSTYLGGSSADVGNAVAVDNSGHAYVAGSTSSSNFPMTAGIPYGGNGDAFVAEFNTNAVGLGSLVYSWDGGGPGADSANGIALDTGGSAYVGGTTSSQNFQPASATGYSTSKSNALVDGFLLKLTPTAAVSYFTYFQSGLVAAVAADSGGNAYVTGQTNGQLFLSSVNQGYQLSGGVGHAFVARFNTNVGGVNSLIYGSYLGGAATDVGTGIATDGTGQAFVVGGTNSSNFPVVGALQPNFGGGTVDAFLSTFNTNASGPASLTYSSYLGGSGSDVAGGVALTPNKNPVIVGTTSSPNIGNPPDGGSDPRAFATKVVFEAPPFGLIDTPLAGATGQAGPINFTGWALSHITVSTVTLCRETIGGEPGVNGLVYLGNAVLVPGVRPDVAAAYPGFPNNNWGWGAQILTNELPGTGGQAIGNGTYNLHAIAADPEGRSSAPDSRDCSCTQRFCVDLGTRTISVNNAASIVPFGTIDTPQQGQTISGSSFINFGWVVTPQPNIVPIDGSTIVVHIDGQVVGHPTYNQFRSDIATLFPGLRNTTSPNGAVGFFVIDTTKLSNGIHNIDWVATDSAGHSGGIGSRNFFVSN
jgi:Beta-propeller repeat